MTGWNISHRQTPKSTTGNIISVSVDVYLGTIRNLIIGAYTMLYVSLTTELLFTVDLGSKFWPYIYNDSKFHCWWYMHHCVHPVMKILMAQKLTSKDTGIYKYQQGFVVAHNGLQWMILFLFINSNSKFNKCKL